MGNSDKVGTFSFGTGTISANKEGIFSIVFFNQIAWQFDIGEISSLDSILSKIENKLAEPTEVSPLTFWSTNGNNVIEVYLGKATFEKPDFFNDIAYSLGLMTRTSYDSVIIRSGGATTSYLPVGEISWFRRNVKVLTEGAPYPRAVKLVDIVDESHVEKLLRVEKFPLNNRNSRSPMRIEREFSQEITKTISIDTSFGVGIDYYIKVNLEGKFGLTKEHKISERVQVSMEAEPGEHKEYVITWKEVTTSGYAVFEVNNDKQRVPFHLTSGLIPDIRQETIAHDK